MAALTLTFFERIGLLLVLAFMLTAYPNSGRCWIGK